MTDDTSHSTVHSSGTRKTDACRIVLNPASGDGAHVDDVYAHAAERGYTVKETEEAGDAISLAKDAASDGVQLLAACGGDGTVHQVVYGLAQADALDETTVAVIPGGTGNNFAENIGVADINQAFELIETGERRRIDLGVADGEPFINSCIAGITAQTSSETASDLKERFGTLAYVLTGIRQAAAFDPLHVAIDAGETETEQSATWEGDALCILVGNARRFTDGGGQAPAEDGRFNITIVEEMPTSDLLPEAAAHRLFGQETEHVTQFTAPHIEITNQQGQNVEFSLDGEMSAHERVSLHVLSRAVELIVGMDYDPTPT